MIIKREQCKVTVFCFSVRTQYPPHYHFTLRKFTPQSRWYHTVHKVCVDEFSILILSRRCNLVESYFFGLSLIPVS